MDQRWWVVARLVLIGAALVGLTGPGSTARASSGQSVPLGVQIVQLGGAGSQDAQDCGATSGTDCNVDNQNVDDTDDGDAEEDD